jgi:DNA helicase-2/ATP-dependent DNA helicase PcrA
VALSRIAPASPGDPPGEDAGAADFLARPEVRDVLAWLRLLLDPQDASAVVRALARPPVELRQVDLARVIQVVRRRKLDLVTGLAAAIEAPQVPPEARERIQRFAELHERVSAAFETLPPDAFVEQLIEMLGARGRPLLGREDAEAQRASLTRLQQLAGDFLRTAPRASARELARHLTAEAPPAGGATAAPAGGAPAGVPQGAPDAATPDPPPVEELETTLQQLREELLESIGRIGGRLSELRLDTDLDISHGVVRYLELLKLAALLQRPTGQSLEEALGDVNARLLAATTPTQREIFQTSTLDEMLLADPGARSAALRSKLGRHEEPSLGPFLPRKGVGLALSASDIETYRSCPLRYKYARVLRIPTEQTLHQRFGIVVHQVLERYHADGAQTLRAMLDLLDAGWRRGGFGQSERESELREMAEASLRRYHARLAAQESEPVWFERSFSFRLGPHHLRGRVDRVDRLAGPGGATYELIDYKTSRPKTAEQLADDVQLSLYALAAREDWRLESSQASYYYILDDLKVPVPRDARDAEAVTDTVLEVGEGILAQEFEPTPSHAACSICDYRIICPVAET